MKHITKIVLTGGPSAGKTSAISRIVNELTERGYYTLVIPETATEIIPNGICVKLRIMDVVSFQTILMKKQLFKEKLYEEAAKMINAEDIVIICDRGILDSKAYVKEEEFERIIRNLDEDVYGVAAAYDAVIHMVTAADGAEEYYTLENNVARTETKEEAIRIDKLTLNSWVGKERLYVVGNENINLFDEKLDKVMEIVYSVLRMPAPVDIQYKYLVKMPDMDYISKIAVKTVTTQIYLKLSRYGEERKIKKVVSDFSKNYYLVKKKFENESKALRTSKIITESEANIILNENFDGDNSEIDKNTSIKERYFFVYNNQYFNLDVYPFSSSSAILEIHSTIHNDKVQIPEFVEVIKDVTNDSSYHNINILERKEI